VTLSTDAGNFRQWRSFFELTVKKFGLLRHIDGTVDAAAMHDDPEWLQLDACIVSWLYSTVSKDIWNDVFRPTNTAYAAWSAITGQFLDNSLQRAVYVQQEFHSLFQGDMSVGEYCGRLKSLADSLYDCGAAVSDQALVINTLRGLNNKFSQAIAVLTTMTPAPTFLYTKSYLLQEETRIKHSLQMEAQTTLIAARDTGSSVVVNKTAPPPPPPSSAPTSTAPSGGGGDRRKKRKADNRNRQGQGAPPPPAGSTAAPVDVTVQPVAGRCSGLAHQLVAPRCPRATPWCRSSGRHDGSRRSAPTAKSGCHTTRALHGAQWDVSEHSQWRRLVPRYRRYFAHGVPPWYPLLSPSLYCSPSYCCRQWHSSDSILHWPICHSHFIFFLAPQ
jgi:hypothetical protein